MTKTQHFRVGSVIFFPGGLGREVFWVKLPSRIFRVRGKFRWRFLTSKGAGMKRNSGFTLIEIAIVLVIIGLLLAGVLKGQELINNAKVKNLAGDFNAIPLYLNVYQDKYHALPGDDRAVQTHLSTSATVAGNGSGNGVIEGLWKPASASDESAVFWQHVRLAGLATGTTAVDISAGNGYLPKNTLGGGIGITGAANSPIATLRGSYIVCSDAIPGKFALQLDIAKDDGLSNAGAMQVIAAGATDVGAAATLPADLLANSDALYLVCMSF